MIQIIAAGLILILVAVWYKFYYAPKKEIERYRLIFEKLGYKVYVEPFVFLGVGVLNKVSKCQKEYKDALHLIKTVYPQADVTLSNIIDKVTIEFINYDLLNSFLSIDEIAKFHKVNFLIQGIKYMLGNGMVFSEGEEWKKKRKIISKVFNFELLKENIPKISEIAQKWLDEFDNSHKFGEGKVKYDLMHLSSKMFCGVITKCFFGCDRVNEKINGQSFEEFILKVVAGAGQFATNPIELILGKFAFKHGLTSRIRNIKEISSIFRGIAKQLSQKRAKQVLQTEMSQKCTDIVQALIYYKKQNQGEEYNYSNEQLLDEFATFLVAGTDTTSHYFTMIVYYVARYPQIQQKLRRQIAEFIKTQEDITFQNLKNLTYIDWIQFETTRHYGPSNGILLRVATEDHYLKDIPIRKGTYASTQPMGNHYNPKLFKDPFTFRPERWESECDNLSPFALTGFSGGPRGCLGKQLALLETKIALVKLVMRYSNFSLPKEDLIMRVKFVYEAEPFDVVFQTKDKQR